MTDLYSSIKLRLFTVKIPQRKQGKYTDLGTIQLVSSFMLVNENL